MRKGRIEKHGRAKTTLPFLPFEDGMVDTMLALIPEPVISCDVCIGHRLKAKPAIHLEDGSPCGNTEYLRIRVIFPRKRKDPLLDRPCHTRIPIGRVYDQPAIGYELPTTPNFDIGKTSPLSIGSNGD